MKETILKVKNLNVELDGEKIICNLSFELKKRRGFDDFLYFNFFPFNNF